MANHIHLADFGKIGDRFADIVLLPKASREIGRRDVECRQVVANATGRASLKNQSFILIDVRCRFANGHGSLGFDKSLKAVSRTTHVDFITRQ